jgi:hypothetical protein
VTLHEQAELVVWRLADRCERFACTKGLKMPVCRRGASQSSASTQGLRTASTSVSAPLLALQVVHAHAISAGTIPRYDERAGSTLFKTCSLASKDKAA